MSDRRMTLDVIEVREPCRASWDSMAGDDRVRFCAHCQKHVHNLSAMPRDEAERLVCESAGSLCVRFAPSSPGGGVLTLDNQRTKPRRRGLFWTAVGLCAALAAAANVIYARRSGPPKNLVTPPGPVFVMGDMCAPMPPTTTPVGGAGDAGQTDPAIEGDAPPVQ